MKLPKIKSIRVYQAVKFDNKLSTYFVSEDTTYQRASEMQVVEGVGVSIKNERDHIIAPFPNISMIQFDTELSKAKKESRKADIEKPAQARNVTRVK